MAISAIDYICTRWTGRITRQGNKRIRWFLTEAAQMAARYDPKMKPFSRKKGHQKALIVVARKMLVSIYYVLTRNELYDGHREDVRIRKIKNMKKVARK